MIINDISVDFALYNKDPDHYEIVHTRYNEHLNKIVEEHMKDFIKEPLMLFEELKNKINFTSDLLERGRNVLAPEWYIDNLQSKLGELVMKFKNSEYAVTQEELQYRKKYYEHLNSLKVFLDWKSFDHEQKFKEFY